MLLVFEGVDRSGKSSQAKLLKERLPGLLGIDKTKVEYIAFPDRDEKLMTGKCIKDFLQRPPSEPSSRKDDEKKNADFNRAIHQLFSANRFEKAAYIRQKLQEGSIIILDRYILSGLVYSTAKGLDFKWCARTDHGLPWPDLTFYMTIDAEVASKRPGFGGEAFETTYFQQRVAEQYDKAIGFLRTQTYTDPTHFIGDIETIKVGSDSIEELHKRVSDIVVQKYIHRGKAKPAYVEHPFQIDF